MEIKVLSAKDSAQHDIYVMPVFSKPGSDKKNSKVTKNAKGKKSVSSAVFTGWSEESKAAFLNLKNSQYFSGNRGESLSYHLSDGTPCLAIGLGEASKFKREDLRKEVASIYKMLASRYHSAAFCLDRFNVLKDPSESAFVMAEAFELASYQFLKHLSKQESFKLKSISLLFKEAGKKSKIQQQIDLALIQAASVNFARDLVNEPPNILNSETYSKRIVEDVKTTLRGKNIKVEVLGKKQLQAEKMNMFLSVNAGSAYEPQLVHLTYAPKGRAKKHVALVGKGLTFDTGGYSLKPGSSMMNMKFDMAGSATVYAAFRAAILSGTKNKITCVLGITDNAVSSLATMPDSIVKARNGKTVEILNTDAEGRLVLGDCLDYVCDLKPDSVIDVATLTGAILVALGSEICGLFSNNPKLVKEIETSAKASDEYMWHLPVIPEFRKEMKSNIADLKNIGASRNGGSAKAAAFLEEFIKNDIPWVHLDIAGVGDSQSHLSYCPAKGASGLVVRTLTHYLLS